MASTTHIDRQCINTIRTLAADAIQKANSGHPGMAIGAATIGYTIFNEMKINPKNPNWQARDRFVLSSGHASMLLYSLLHINGYDVSVDDIKNFRQPNSKTPGHPELNVTPGVDASTGPLGQGFAMAVGLAAAEAHLAKIFNRPKYEIFDNYTFTLMGDGCMMEGISSEAASFAGANHLGKLIAIYDSNDITIEGKTDITFSDDTRTRFIAYGFHVQTVENGEDIMALTKAIEIAKAEKNRPSLIVVKTNIAHGTKKVGQACTHGEPLGDECIAEMKKDMHWDEPPFTVPEEVYEHFAKLQLRREQEETKHNQLLERYRKEFPELAKKLDAYFDENTRKDAANKLLALIDSDKVPNKPQATRASSGEVLNSLFSDIGLDNLFGGSADLGSSNKTVIEPKDFFSFDSEEGKNIHFGVRELFMAAMCNGIMLYKGLSAYCATFMVFADYLKPSLRLSALMSLPVMYVLTHDSIGVGEDGPTHHPIEQLLSLRATPGVSVFRPADYRETVCAYSYALSSKTPTVISLSRQNLPQCDGTGKQALSGAYNIKKYDNANALIIATGSELSIAVNASDLLAKEGILANVVSMPCVELFEAQASEYKESVLPESIKARVSVEAGATLGWYKYIGTSGVAVGVDSYSGSAPASYLQNVNGLTAENVALAVKKSLEKQK